MKRLVPFKTSRLWRVATLRYLLLLTVIAGLTACATAPQELMVVVDSDRMREFHDAKNKVAEFNRKEVDQPLPMNLFIRMQLEVTDDSSVLWLKGKDKDIAREDDQVLDDMQKIVTKIERCCGIKGQAGGPVKGK